MGNDFDDATEARVLIELIPGKGRWRLNNKESWFVWSLLKTCIVCEL